MWVKLFFRHIAASIRKSPLQPVLSVILIALAFFITACSLNVYSCLLEETRLGQQARYGSADIAISLNSTTSNRFMRTRDAKEVLGEGVSAAGCYQMPVSMDDGELFFAAGVNFEEADDIFTFEFTDYGRITADRTDKTALITRQFAQKYALGIGDSFSAEVLGYTLTYEVEGISELPFMDSYDVLVSVRGVMRALAADSPFIAALGDDCELYNSIYVRSDGDARANAERLSLSPAFADKTVSVVSDIIEVKANMSSMSSIIVIILLFIAVIAAAVVFCCFYILAGERAQTNLIFAECGADSRTLLALQCSEIAIYWAAGSALGFIAALAATAPLIGLCEFRYIFSPLGVQFALNCLIALTVTLATSAMTAVFFYIAERLGRRARRHGGRAIKLGAYAMLAAASAACTAAAFLTPPYMHVGFAATGILCVIALVFSGMPELFKGIMAKLSCMPSGGRMLCAAVATRNARRVGALRNSCRLFALLIAAAVAMAVVLFSSEKYIDSANALLPADYMLLNASQAATQRAAECSGVESALPVYWNSALDGDDSVMIIGAKDYSALDERFRPPFEPSGNVVILTAPFAELKGYSVGDSFTVELEGRELELTVGGTMYSPLSSIYIDCEGCGVYYNIVAVKGDGSVSGERLKANLAAELAADLTIIISADDYTEQLTTMFGAYMKCGDLLFWCFIIFSVIGLGDNLIRSYRSRREQFLLLRACGMTAGGVRAVKLWEMALTAAISLAAAAATAILFLVLIDGWMASYAVNFFALLIF